MHNSKWSNVSYISFNPYISLGFKPPKHSRIPKSLPPELSLDLSRVMTDQFPIPFSILLPPLPKSLANKSKILHKTYKYWNLLPLKHYLLWYTSSKSLLVQNLELYWMSLMNDLIWPLEHATLKAVICPRQNRGCGLVPCDGSYLLLKYRGDDSGFWDSATPSIFYSSTPTWEDWTGRLLWMWGCTSFYPFLSSHIVLLHQRIRAFSPFKKEG
jgi:hypothetical protein